ncbi:zinc finger CCCH domain-containing protein 17 [Juglans microcarpa x Juglans regia]|uniref:zinc finger CCCH domain-containing protein 17 n=1 Tax=Juglans microcarpa x Juglans regia TaxID=2249226 RepID=UPI001B7F0B17|nr:zinc finger CCCH domain-containing protein 17 [Juglans microcarpa x Juglans regia]
MVGAVQQEQQQQQEAQRQQQQKQKQASSAPTTSSQEEALKRNTDCVYFLASPLTCKKGSECEYRHSEFARLNPRDCWYWLNGNCLNPKCSFRHPPLDASLGAQAATSVGSSLPTAQTAAIPATNALYGSSKQAVPCIFYQKGHCLKGDRCAFSHGPSPTTSNKVPQALATNVTEPLTSKKTFGGLEKFNQEQKIPQLNVLKPAQIPPHTKSAPKAETDLPRSIVGIERNIPPPMRLEDDAFRYRATNAFPLISGNTASRSNRSEQTHVPEDHSLQNGKDADDFLRESSPGFDVLVDDELGDSDYYHGEDQFEEPRDHEGMNVNSVNEYDLGNPADYNSMGDVDRPRFHVPRGHGSYNHKPGQHAWEQHRASSERMVVKPAHMERRRGHRESGSPDQIYESDLRYHLAKQRRVNGLRSVVSRDHAHDNNVEGQNYGSSSRRDALHLPSNESSLSNRLRGRITLPGRSFPVNGGDLHGEKELDKGKSWGRLSPGRPQIFHGRLRDRIKGRVQEDFNEGRNLRSPHIRREITDDNADFVRPKSLAELKVVKIAESKEEQSLGKRKNIDYHQQSEGHLSFEGPKPLNEILKRKRDAEVASSGAGKLSINRGDYNQREMKQALAGSASTAVIDTQSVNEDDVGHLLGNKEESKNTTVAIRTPTKKTDEAYGSSQAPPNVDVSEAEDGMIFDETVEELEGDDDQRDGDYDYEQADDGEYNIEEGENANPEEYVDDEDGDGDDFAKKIGVMFS